ncbi:hypothetical protein CTI12_AA576710 [Artemisia annua]|uniref:Uncharacterized protein n=1 Tax=Artemisia annua TaxID=35608 RepID=A0A2U1KQD5_ARTAN|nr:hypothetical protein CTI12_AA576710 [Artemisia annua]
MCSRIHYIEVSSVTRGLTKFRIVGISTEGLFVHQGLDNTRFCHIVQVAKLRKIADIREDGEDSIMSTQEYIRKFVEDLGEDNDFTRGSWVSTVEYLNAERGIVVAIIKSCTPNALGYFIVTLKDLSDAYLGLYGVCVREKLMYLRTRKTTSVNDATKS